MAFAIPLALSGLTPDSAENLELDCGMVIGNGNIPALQASGVFEDLIDEESSWSGADGGGPYAPFFMGATIGGLTLNPNSTERQIRADGARTPIKGFGRWQRADPTIRVNLLEAAKPRNVDLSYGGAIQTNYPVSGTARYREYRMRTIIRPQDYLGNICVCVTISGESQPMIYVLENARVVERSEMTLADDAEKVLSITFQGHALLTSPLTIPWAQYLPIDFGS